MQEIAEQAGVGVGTLYRHFGSKDEMAGAILAHHVDAMAFRVGEIAARGGSPFERLSRALRRSAGDLAANPLARFCLTGAGAAARLHAVAARRRFERSFVALIEGARRDGSLRPGFGPDDVGTLMAAVCTVTDERRPECAQRLLDIAIDGLRAPCDDALAIS